MIETTVEGQEVELQDLTVKVSPKEDFSRSQLEELLEVFKAGYGDDWLGDDLFWNVRLKNATELLELRSGNQMAAAILFDNLRILQVTVHPDFQGHGLGVKLLQEAAKIHPETWISVATDAEPMLHTVTDKALDFIPVDDKDKIEALIGNINGGKNSFEVDTREIEAPYLTGRLAEKGVTRERFTAYAAKTGSTHGDQYWQFLFQNQPNSTS